MPEIADIRFPVCAAEPVEFEWVETRARRFKERRGWHSAERSANYGAVEGAIVVESVCHRETAGSGLVLHDHRWITGNPRRKMTSKHACIDVIAGANSYANDNPNGFTPVKVSNILLSYRGIRDGCQNNEGGQQTIPK